MRSRSSCAVRVPRSPAPAPGRSPGRVGRRWRPRGAFAGPAHTEDAPRLGKVHELPGSLAHPSTAPDRHRTPRSHSMSSTEENKSVVRAFVDAWNTKDLDRFDDLLSDNARVTVAGTTMS